MLHLPVLPSDVENLWRVELEIDARGSGAARQHARGAADSDAQQEIFDERQTNDRLVFTIRTDKDQRTGVWSGRFDGVHNLSHGFRVQLADEPLPMPTQLQKEPPKEIVGAVPAPSDARFPADAPEVRELLASVAPPSTTDPLGQMRGLLAYVTDEIGTASTGSDDALLTPGRRRGQSAGEGAAADRAAARVRASRRGWPRGCGCARTRRRRKRCGSRLGSAAAGSPLSPTLGFFGARPPDLLLLAHRQRDRWSKRRASTPCRIATACCASRCARRKSRRSWCRPNPLLAAVSLYRLPVGSQAALRILLVFPIGALIIALLRNLVGVRTFGTFMPLLDRARAARAARSRSGSALVGSVIVLGIVSRLLLERLQLLLVPRLGVLLCVVVLAITAHSLLGRSYEVKDLFASVLFPVVILTMLIERFSITTAEEGLPRRAAPAGDRRR